MYKYKRTDLYWRTLQDKRFIRRKNNCTTDGYKNNVKDRNKKKDWIMCNRMIWEEEEKNKSNKLEKEYWHYWLNFSWFLVCKRVSWSRWLSDLMIRWWCFISISSNRLMNSHFVSWWWCNWSTSMLLRLLMIASQWYSWSKSLQNSVKANISIDRNDDD